MKVVILAGGLGTRLSEETVVKPKPMVEIGSKPIIWHIMKIYGRHGIEDFVVCLGYKGYVIKEFFTNYLVHGSDLTIDLKTNRSHLHGNSAEPWRVTLIDTGDKTMTGGRVLRVRSYLENETFMLTYGDGVADIDIKRLLAFHRGHGKLATVTGGQRHRRRRLVGRQDSPRLHQVPAGGRAYKGEKPRLCKTVAVRA